MKKLNDVVHEYFPNEKIINQKKASFKIDSKGKIKNTTLGFAKFKEQTVQMVETEHFYFFDRRDYLIRQSTNAFKMGIVILSIVALVIFIFYFVKIPKAISIFLFFPAVFALTMILGSLMNLQTSKSIGGIIVLRKDLIEDKNNNGDYIVLKGKNTFSAKFFDYMINVIPSDKKDFFYPGKNLTNMPILKLFRKMNTSSMYTDFIITYKVLE